MGQGTAERLAGVGDELVLTRALAPLAPWAAMLWAAGGVSAVRAGSPLAGAVILGLVGAAAVMWSKNSEAFGVLNLSSIDPFQPSWNLETSNLKHKVS